MDLGWDAQRPQYQAHWTGDPKRLSGSQALRRRKYLSGLLECGVCGGKMTVAGRGNRKRYYCANHKEKGAASTSWAACASARIAPFVPHQLVEAAPFSL